MQAVWGAEERDKACLPKPTPPCPGMAEALLEGAQQGQASDVRRSLPRLQGVFGEGSLAASLSQEEDERRHTQTPSTNDEIQVLWAQGKLRRSPIFKAWDETCVCVLLLPLWGRGVWGEGDKARGGLWVERWKVGGRGVGWLICITPPHAWVLSCTHPTPLTSHAKALAHACLHPHPHLTQTLTKPACHQGRGAALPQERSLLLQHGPPPHNPTHPPHPPLTQ